MWTPPLTEETVRALRVGDVVLITGEMYTGRDAVHAFLTKSFIGTLRPISEGQSWC